MENKLKIIMALEEKKEGVHMRELSRRIGTGMPNVLRYVNLLEKEGVVRKEKDANLIKVKLKPSERTLALLNQLNAEKFLSLPKKIQQAIKDFILEINVKPLIVVLFGSYAKGTHTKESDIDILLVFQKVDDEQALEGTAKRISQRTNTKISPAYIDYGAFERNILDKKHEFSKEIRNNVIVISGVEHYYALVWRFFDED